MSNSEIPKGAGSAETSRHSNEGGWYKAVDVNGDKVRVLAVNHPKFGSAQADAYLRLGYEYDGPASEEDLKEVPFIDDRQLHSTGNQASAQVTIAKEDFEDMKARLRKLEEERAEVEEMPLTAQKPLKLWNKDQLTAKATELGLGVPEGTTNKEIVAMIEEKLDN